MEIKHLIFLALALVGLFVVAKMVWAKYGNKVTG